MRSVQNEDDNADWDKSVKSSRKVTMEERIAQKLADEVLQNQPVNSLLILQQLKNIHSKQSLRKILEKEAHKQLGAEYKGPVMSVIKEHEKNIGSDPSYLPYLHKNPAI